MIKLMDAALMIVDHETQIIPGHGTMSNKKELKDYREMLSTILAG